MKINKALLATAAIVSLTAALPANAATTVVDFSGHGTGGQIGNTYAALGLTFENATFAQCGGGCPAPTPNGFFAYNNDNPFTALFASEQTSVSFQGVSNSNTIAQAYNAMNQLVATVVDNQGYPVNNAVRTLSGNGITRVVFSGVPGITNLTFNATAVPEPATWAMMLVGFGMMGASMRYRRRSTKAVLA